MKTIILSIIIISVFFFTGWSCLGHPDDDFSSSTPRNTILLSSTFDDIEGFTLSG